MGLLVKIWTHLLCLYAGHILQPRIPQYQYRCPVCMTQHCWRHKPRNVKKFLINNIPNFPATSASLDTRSFLGIYFSSKCHSCFFLKHSRLYKTSKQAQRWFGVHTSRKHSTVPCNIVIPESLMSSQLVKMTAGFYKTLTFTTVFTRAHYLSLYRTSWNQFTPFEIRL